MRGGDIGRILEFVVRWSRLLEGGHTRPFGETPLSRSQIDALFLIAHSTDPLTPGALAQTLRLTPGAVTQLLDGIRRAGLIVQQPHPRDARSRVLALSPAAREQVEQFESALVERLAPRFEALSDDEVATVAALLARADDRPRPPPRDECAG